MTAKILGTGSYLPPKIVTNDELAKTLDTNDEWIFSHTGIHARHVAGADDCTSSMAAKAAGRALEAAGTKPEEIGLVILATTTPDYNTFPATACIVQHALGCRHAGAFDLQAACSGFVYALDMARNWSLANNGRKAIVIGAETLSRIVDWKDRASCILFGDGAGAVVIGGVEDDADAKYEPFAYRSLLGADGGGADFITREGGTRQFIAPDEPDAGQAGTLPKLNLQGHAVFAFAVKTLSAVVKSLCMDAGKHAADLDRIFAHQANGRIIEAVARRMNLPLEKFFMNLATTANTSAASIPISLDEAVRNGELKEGDLIALAGFGAGLTYAGALMQWPHL
ncbi:MAG: ketoacyl-ACP synthase III [Kiritimatiellae bacterium]|nr:ketoacyl-ACP synthase III [Kiritimatiellia bacterium]